MKTPAVNERARCATSYFDQFSLTSAKLRLPIRRSNGQLF
jgi:hypothetical protein